VKEGDLVRIVSVLSSERRYRESVGLVVRYTGRQFSQEWFEVLIEGQVREYPGFELEIITEW